MSILSLDFDHYFEKKKTNETAHNRGAKPRVRTLKKKKKKQTKKKLRIVINILHFQGLSFRIVSFEPFYLEGSKVQPSCYIKYFRLNFTRESRGTLLVSSNRFEACQDTPLGQTLFLDRAFLSFSDSAGQSDHRIGHVEVLLFIECHIINLFRIKTFCGKSERLGIVCRSGNSRL